MSYNAGKNVVFIYKYFQYDHVLAFVEENNFFSKASLLPCQNTHQNLGS